MSDVSSLFQRVYGRRPQAAWTAPGRVNLIGEHTDYNDGFVLPIALPQGVTAAVAGREDGRLRLWSAQRSGGVTETDAASLAPGTPSDWAAYVAGVFWSLRRHGHRLSGVDILIDGDIPMGAGLSSSAALECATAAAMYELLGMPVDRTAIAQVAQRVENEFVGVPCGVMDQMAAMLCTEGHALFLDTRTLAVAQVPLDLAAHGLALVVIDTRAPHTLAASGYAERRKACERAAAALGVRALRDVDIAGLDAALASLDDAVARQRVRHVVTENDRVLRTVELLHQDRPRDVGGLLCASHASLRDDFQVSCPELDTAVSAALSVGAYGARMTGGGFGGSAIALADAGAVELIAEAVTNAFAAQGFGRPGFMMALPSQGARRRDVA